MADKTIIMPNQPKLLSIALLAYPGAQMAAILGLADLFDIANRHDKVGGTGSIELSHTIIDATIDFSTARPIFDIVVVPPNLTGARGEADRTIHDFLRTQHNCGTTICSVCAGAFWLGHAGLLNGRPATTHWALEEEFRQRFPDVALAVDRILIDDNDIVTAGGVMAWIDLGLYLVGRYLGAEAVSRTARHLLVDPQGREQKNYRTFRPELTHGDDPIRKLQHFMEQNSGGELTVAALAQRANMSERSLARRFLHATGFSPNAYVQQLRIERARGLLERTRVTVAQAAFDVGYSDVSAFAKTFRSITGLTPSGYRRRFQISD